MNKNDLIEKGFIFISRKKTDPHIEVWAKLTGRGDEVKYCYYIPDMDSIDDETIRTMSFFNELEMLSIMKDKLMLHLSEADEESNKSIWSSTL